MYVTLLDCGNSMRVKIRAFPGLEALDLVLFFQFTSRFIISGCDEWILCFIKQGCMGGS